ncbi:hypothetical protein QCA50_017099 [Cerrena zonata]|uniref:Uncharacterized protein n=1 Tax=Cerrena zonata TaxID=2478898 RepID=A0AAW0FHM3_9APHY
MAQRDLTFNTPQVNVLSEDSRRPSSELHNQNPFVNPTEEEETASSFDGQSYSQSDEDTYGRPYNGYYSQNGTTSNLLSSQHSSNEENIFANARNQTTSNGYRYNALSQTSILRWLIQEWYQVLLSTLLIIKIIPAVGAAGAGAGAGAAAAGLAYSKDDESLTDPFLHSSDFSPFGGYPAQLFPLHIDEKEPDDYLHNPDPIADAHYDKHRFSYDLKRIDKRSFGGICGILSLAIVAIVIFVILPVLTYSGVTSPYKPESYEKLSPYSYPLVSSIRTSLVDPDTPDEARKIKNSKGKEWKLVFSDEFNVEGRTFYEGDDQFFYAPDFHYAATQDLEWYDPDACYY